MKVNLFSSAMIALLVAGPAFGKTPAKAKAEPVKASTLTVDAAASAVTWKATKVVGGHDGNVKIKSGKVTVEGNIIKSVDIVVDMSSISCRDLEDAEYNKKLVDHLKSADFFDVAKHNTASFKLTSVKDGTATGNLTMKGISKPVTFPAVFTTEGGITKSTINLKVNRLDWGLKYNSGKFFDPKKLGDKMINDDFEIGISLAAK